jgi:hypothetical protein
MLRLVGWQMSALMLVEKLNYIRIIAADGQCGRLQEMHRQVVGLSHQDAIGVECTASCNKRPTLVATGVRDG